MQPSTPCEVEREHTVPRKGGRILPPRQYRKEEEEGSEASLLSSPSFSIPPPPTFVFTQQQHLGRDSKVSAIRQTLQSQIVALL